LWLDKLWRMTIPVSNWSLRCKLLISNALNSLHWELSLWFTQYTSLVCLPHLLLRWNCVVYGLLYDSWRAQNNGLGLHDLLMYFIFLLSSFLLFFFFNLFNLLDILYRLRNILDRLLHVLHALLQLCRLLNILYTLL